MKFKFLVNTPTVNRYGYRVLSSGGNFENFKKNNVCLDSHDRWEGVSESIVGTWEDLEVDAEGNLYASFVPDTSTTKNQEIAKMVEKGLIKACSMAFNVLESSDAPEYILPGQRYSTVTKWELLEISLVVIPGNQDAVRVLSLSADSGLPPKGLTELNLNHKTPIVMEKVLKLIGATDEASAIINVTELQKKAAKADELALKLNEIEASQQEAKCLALVDEAVKCGKLLPSQKDAYLALAKADFAATETALETLEAYTSLSGQVDASKHRQESGKTDAERYELAWKEGKLEAWKKTSPEDFNRCKDAYFASAQ